MVTDNPGLDDALARARAGDEAGFLDLWRDLQPRLLRYLRVLGRDDADDLASETWLQVVRDLQRFNGGADDFRRWLFTVGRHRAIDAARARLRRRVSLVPLDADTLVDDQRVEEQVVNALSVGKAIEFLTRLPKDQAEAVALRVIADLETGAVATVLGKSAGAVRVALHRGLRTLADDPEVQALSKAARVQPPSATPLPKRTKADSVDKASPAGGDGTSPTGDPSLRTLEEVD
jgi:RNA polymerase sigma-70 factor, ECF subfamily